MIPIIYEKNETSFVSNGLGRLRDCMTCEVTEERNGIYELDFTYPVDGVHYDLIQPGRIVAVTHDDTGDVQPFDIVSFSKPISGVVTFHAVHISYRLSSMITWATGINSLTSAMNLLNNISGTGFSFSANFTRNGYMAAADGVPRSVRQMLGGIEGSILDTYGGEYGFNKWNVTLYKARGKARDLTIRYGVNMLDYNEEVDYQGTYTSVIPYWTGMDGAKQVVVRGSRVDSGLTPYNGRRQVVPLDLSEKFENKPTAAQLQTEAATYLAANQPNLPAQTISVDFFRLQDTPEYADLASLLTCQICDTINVIFPMYNMQGRFKIVKTVWDVLAEKYTSMELGTLSTSLAEALGISTAAGSYAETDDLGVGGDLTVGGTITGVGNVALSGTLTMNNAENIYMKDTGGTECAVLSMSTSNNTVLGYGGYDASQGGTNIYGNTVRLYANNAITFNQPLAALFKVTDVSKSVSSIAAHSYQNGISFSMTAQSGYNAVGVVGWSSSNFRIYPFRVEVTSNTNITASLSNATAAASADFTMHFYVLWLKATSA